MAIDSEGPEKANNEDSEQSVGVSKKQAVKKTAKKAAVKPKVEVVEEDDPIAQISVHDVVVFMNAGHSYYGPEVEFTRDAPFQRMSAVDAQTLISSMPKRFSLATREQIQQFYSLG